MSGAREWTGLLPGYVLEDRDRHRLALVWGADAAARRAWRSRRPGAAAARRASLGLLVAAAQLAAAAAHARTDDRDAVRLVGRPALAVPGWRQSRAAAGAWTSAALGWGPLYEPHRQPGRRRARASAVALAAASYLLELVAEISRRRSRAGVARDRPRPAWCASARGARCGSARGLALDAVEAQRDSTVDLRLTGGPSSWSRSGRALDANLPASLSGLIVSEE